MEIPAKMNMAQKYAVSRDNPEEVFQFFLKNFGCARKVYNLSVDNYYKHLEAALKAADRQRRRCRKAS